MEDEARVRVVRVLIEVVYARGVEERGAALNSVNYVAFGEEQLCEIGSVLAGNSCNQCFFQQYLH